MGQGRQAAVRRESWLSFLWEPLRALTHSILIKASAPRSPPGNHETLLSSHLEYFPFSSFSEIFISNFHMLPINKTCKYAHGMQTLYISNISNLQGWGRIKQGRRLASSNNTALINTWNIYRTHKEQRKLNTSSVYTFSQCLSQPGLLPLFFLLRCRLSSSEWDVPGQCTY